MIARQFRFHGYNALRFVYKAGKTARSQSVLLRYASNPRRQQPRIAVVVAKKIDKSAVVRNRIRRRLYAAIETEGVGQWPTYDMVFTVVDPSMANRDEKYIKDTILRLLQVSVRNHQAVEK